MKLEKLKCKTCGAQLKVEKGASHVKCDFCGTSFSVEDAYNEGYNYTKGVLKAQSEHREEELQKAEKVLNSSDAKKIATIAVVPFYIIPILIIIIFFVIVIVFGLINNNKLNDNSMKSFNYSYEIYSGKQSSFFLTNVLDDIVTNNKTNKNHVITVVYKDISSTEETKIKEIRDILDNHTNYDVSLDYDSTGYVNKFTITDINN